MSDSDPTTAGLRAQAWQTRYEAAGGHRLPVNLSWVAWQALQQMAPARGRGPLLEQLVIDEARRRGLLTAEQLAVWESSGAS